MNLSIPSILQTCNDNKELCFASSLQLYEFYHTVEPRYKEVGYNKTLL